MGALVHISIGKKMPFWIPALGNLHDLKYPKHQISHLKSENNNFIYHMGFCEG